MNRKVLYFAIFALLAANIYGQTPEINEELKKKIFMALPASAMPDVLKTAAQRNQAEMNFGEDNRVGGYLSNKGGDTWQDFTMAIFPFDDGANLLLIVQNSWCLDGCFLESDKTLNYHIASGRITEIKRPIEPVTANMMMNRMDFGDLKPGTKQKMMRWFDQTDKLSKVWYSFPDNGMTAHFSPFLYDDGVYDYDYWLNYRNPSFYTTPAHYRWDGKRFIKEKEPEYSRMEIDSERTNINLRNSPKDGAVVLQANGGDKFIIKTEPTLKEDGSAWYAICYAIDKDGVITYMPTFLYVAARFAVKSPLEDGDTERMAAAEQRAHTNDNPIDTGLAFINAYIDFLNKEESIGTMEWLNANRLTTNHFKTELKKMIDEAFEEDPEMGLGFNPILDAQDYPSQGFEFESFDSNTNYLTVKGKNSPEFKVIIRLLKRGTNWLIDGCGAVNIPDNKKR